MATRLRFRNFNKMEIRQWVEDNPRPCVDSDGETMLRTAACVKNDVALIKWLVNEKG